VNKPQVFYPNPIQQQFQQSNNTTGMSFNNVGTNINKTGSNVPSLSGTGVIQSERKPKSIREI